MSKLPVSEAQRKIGRARRAAGEFHFRYHKRWHSDALRGMSELTPEQRGVYNTLIDLQYERRGPLPDDDAWLARVNNCPLRTYRRIKAELLAAGRLVVDEAAGALYDERCLRELTDAGVLRETLAEAGRRGGEKRAAKRVEAAARKAAAVTTNGAKNGDNFADFPVTKLQELVSGFVEEQALSEKEATQKSQASQNPEDSSERESTGPDHGAPRAARTGGGAPVAPQPANASLPTAPAWWAEAARKLVTADPFSWRAVWSRAEPVCDDPPTLRAPNATIAAGLRRQAGACRGLLGFEVVVEGVERRVVGR